MHTYVDAYKPILNTRRICSLHKKIRIKLIIEVTRLKMTFLIFFIGLLIFVHILQIKVSEWYKFKVIDSLGDFYAKPSRGIKSTKKQHLIRVNQNQRDLVSHPDYFVIHIIRSLKKVGLTKNLSSIAYTSTREVGNKILNEIIYEGASHLNLRKLSASHITFLWQMESEF